MKYIILTRKIIFDQFIDRKKESLHIKRIDHLYRTQKKIKKFYIKKIINMENRQLINLGARNKSISKLKAMVHTQNRQTEPCYASKVLKEPHPISQTFKLIQKLPSKQNLTSSFYSVAHGQVHHVPILQENHALSHQNFYMSSPQSRIAQSKEKVRANMMNENIPVKTRQGSPVNRSNSRCKFIQNESNKNLLTLTLNQNAKQVQLMSKIKILEQVLSQKQAEHQHFQSIILHERNQNQNLIKRNHQLIKENQQSKMRISELEEMLEREISKSLELMDNNESYQKEIEEIRASIQVKDTLVNNLQVELNTSDEKVTAFFTDIEIMRRERDSKVSNLQKEMERAKLESQSNIKELRAKINSIECQLLKVNEQSAQKDQLIVQLQINYQDKLQTLIQQKQIQVSELNQTIRSQTTQLASFQSQIQSMGKSQPKFFTTQQRPQSQTEKPECKKCKELLQTVFRLNSHLNKK